MPDEVARIGALSNGSNGQRSLESASLHFEAIEGVNPELAEGASRVGACRAPCFDPHLGPYQGLLKLVFLSG
jgi:hypothetical protein